MIACYDLTAVFTNIEPRPRIRTDYVTPKAEASLYSMYLAYLSGISEHARQNSNLRPAD